jgi:large subunit ribosomal protein L5
MMYDFLEKLIGITFPRVKDFRGVNYDAVDEMGNMSIGFREHTSFPEAAGEDVRSAFGLGVTIVTSAKSKDEAIEMLKGIGMPFSKK